MWHGGETPELFTVVKTLSKLAFAPQAALEVIWILICLGCKERLQNSRLDFEGIRMKNKTL